MASVLLICVCLMGSVYSQTVKKTTETNIFVDPANPLADAFHNVAATAEGSLVSQANIAGISQNLQGFSQAELPAALKQILAGATSPNAAVRIANQNSDKLLNTDGNKIQKAFQVFQNNAALQQVLELQREKESAAQSAQTARQMRSELARVLQEQQQKQQLLLRQQQRQQLLLQQQQQQQQQREQQGNSPFADTRIPNVDQNLIAANLLSISSNDVTTGTTDPGSSGSSISSRSTSTTTKVVTKSSRSEKKRELEERLNKLRERIAKKKKEKAEKAKKAAEAAKRADAMTRAAARETAQSQTEELSRNNEFNTESSPPEGIAGVSSQDVLIQAGENAAAEARIAGILENQGQVTSETPVVPFGQHQGFIPSTATSQFSPQSTIFTGQAAQGMSFVPSFNSPTQIFQSGSQSAIGSFDISNAQSVPTQANAMSQSVGVTRSAAVMPNLSRRGFLARVDRNGEVVPLTNTVGGFRSPSSFVQFASPSRFISSSATTSPYTYTSALFSSPYQNYAPYTTSYSTMSPIMNSAPYTMSPIMNSAPYTMSPIMNSAPYTMSPIINSAPYTSFGGNVQYSSSFSNPTYTTSMPSLQTIF